MSKTIDTSQLENELHQSKFFAPRDKTTDSREPSSASTKQAATPAVKTTAAFQQDDDERELKRYSHDLYIDQVKTLETQTRAYFLAKGDHKSKAQMIREAIDAYISAHQ